MGSQESQPPEPRVQTPSIVNKLSSQLCFQTKILSTIHRGGGRSISDWGYHQGTSIGVPETAALTAVVAETRDVIWLGMVGPLNNCKYHRPDHEEKTQKRNGKSNGFQRRMSNLETGAQMQSISLKQLVHGEYILHNKGRLGD